MVKWIQHDIQLLHNKSKKSILIWRFPNPERWGAFAGGFENVEYEEREDDLEFVIVPLSYTIIILTSTFLISSYILRKTSRCYGELGALGSRVHVR